MAYKNAVLLVQAQRRNIRKVGGIVIDHNGFQYRLTYKGGFAEYVAIDRREIGKRNYKYFGGFGAYHCVSAEQVLKMAMEKIEAA